MLTKWKERDIISQSTGDGPKRQSKYPGVATFGIALEWGSRGRWFESSNSDHKKRLAFARRFLRLVCLSAREVCAASEVALRAVKCLRTWEAHWTSLCAKHMTSQWHKPLPHISESWCFTNLFHNSVLKSKTERALVLSVFIFMTDSILRLFFRIAYKTNRRLPRRYAPRNDILTLLYIV